MKHTLLALGCALALAGGNALAADTTHDTTAAPGHESSGGGFVDKTKEAFHKLGQSVKSGFHKAENKMDSAKSSDKDETRSMGAGRSRDPAADNSDRQKRMDSAYDDYKAKPSSSSDHEKKSGEHAKPSEHASK